MSDGACCHYCRRYECTCDLPKGETIGTLLLTIEKLRAEVEALRETSRWIPVEERLPEVDTLVMVATDRGAHVASRDGRDDDWWWTPSDTVLHRPITHWRPLPASPEEAR